MGSRCTSEKWAGPGCGHYCENINRKNPKTANPQKKLTRENFQLYGLCPKINRYIVYYHSCRICDYSSLNALPRGIGVWCDWIPCTKIYNGFKWGQIYIFNINYAWHYALLSTLASNILSDAQKLASSAKNTTSVLVNITEEGGLDTLIPEHDLVIRCKILFL